MQHSMIVLLHDITIIFTENVSFGMFPKLYKDYIKYLNTLRNLHFTFL